MKIAIDVDGVVADIMTVWLEMYNRDYSDNLKPSDITDWNVKNFVKRSCGELIHEYPSHAGFYQKVKPLPGAIDGVLELRRLGHDVVFASALYPNQYDQKVAWLAQHGFITSKAQFMAVSDKSLIRADILLDDGLHNCQSFHVQGQYYAYLFNQPWNAISLANSGIIRVFDWEEFVHLVK